MSVAKTAEVVKELDPSEQRGSRASTRTKRRVVGLLPQVILAGVAILAGANAPAQTFPGRPIRIVVPYAAGGSVDILARMIALPMSKTLGVPVIVDNRAGGGAAIGAEAVAKSAPDGHTLLLTPNALAIMPALYKQLGFDPLRDLSPVSMLIATDLVLVASSRLTAQTLADMVTYAKAHPGTLNYGSTGVANPLHLTMEMLKAAAGIDIVPIPYKGDAPLNSALLAGEVDLAVLPLGAAATGIRAHWLRPLALAGGNRSPFLPEVSTLVEQGYPGFETGSWQGLFVAAGTTAEIIAKLQRAAVAALDNAEAHERLQGFSQTLVGSSAETFGTRFRADVARFSRIVQQAAIASQE